MTTLLDVRDLTVSFPGRRRAVTPVRGVSFTVEPGQRLGLLGESGSGKSLTGLALMGLLPARAVVGGEVLLDGRDLLALSEHELSGVRGNRVSMIFQNPMTALNPVKTIGAQIAEAVRAHGGVSAEAARERAGELLEEVGVIDAQRRLGAYPHEFSGGMRQRVVIAIALAADPALIVADEATTALDVTTQARIVDLLLDIVARRNAAVIFITHDLAVASSFCTDVQVMYAGRIVERASAARFYGRQAHPYSEALVGSICGPDADVTQPIVSIDGQPPLASRMPGGCSFHPRCPWVIERCVSEAPPAVPLGDGAMAECHRAQERMALAGVTRDRATSQEGR